MNVDFNSVVNEVKGKEVGGGEGLVAAYKNTLLRLLGFIGEVRFEEFVEVMKSMEGWYEAKDLFSGKFFNYNVLVNLFNEDKKCREDFKRWVEYGVDDDIMWSIIKVNRQRLNMYLRLYFGLCMINEKGKVLVEDSLSDFNKNALELYVYYLCVGLMREVINK